MVKVRKATFPLFLIIWVFGILIGALLSACNSQLSVNVARMAMSNPPTFIGVLIVNVLPLAILVIMLSRRIVAPVYPLILLESLSRGFCGMSIINFLGNGAWVLRFLFLFSPGCVSALIWYLLFNYTRGGEHRFFNDVCILSSLVFLVTVVDYFAISPFLVRLSKYF